MSKRHWFGLCGALLACGGPKESKTITFGSSYSLTGDLANTASEELDAANLAVKEINAHGGVLGANLVLVNHDDGSDADKAKVAAQAHLDAQVPVVFGGGGSGVTLAGASVLNPAKVVVISPAATSPELTTYTDDGFLFRTAASDALQGKLLAKRAQAKGFTKVAVVHIPDSYGRGLAGAFVAAFTAGGGTITANTEFNEGETSYVSLLTTTYAAGVPDAIVLVAFAPDGGQILKDYLANFASNATFWLLTDGVEDPGFPVIVGASNFNNIQHEGTGPGVPQGPRFEAFKANFQAEYGRAVGQGTYAANAYDSVYLVALSAEAGGAATGVAIRDNLAAVSSGGAAFGPAEYVAARDAAKAKQDVNFEGASGPVDFDASGDVVATYALWKIQAGAIVITEGAVNP